MIVVTLFDAEGKITGKTGLEDSAYPILAGLLPAHVVGDYAPQDWFVVDGVATKRPAQSSQLDGLVLRDLPVPCSIEVDGVAHLCSDGVAELEFAHAGTYSIKVVAFPYLDWETEVQA